MRVCAVLIGALTCCAMAGHATTISVDPLTTSTPVSGMFSLNIDVRSITDLYAYEFDLAFNPVVLSATAMFSGPFLEAARFIPGAIDNVAGAIQFTAGTLFGPVPGVSGSGTLATIEFTALASGTSPIMLSNLVFLDSNLADIAIDAVNSGSVTVTANEVVPEPSQGVGVLIALSCLLIPKGLELIGKRQRLARMVAVARRYKRPLF